MTEEILNKTGLPFDLLLPKKLEESKETKKVIAALESNLRPLKMGTEYMLPSFPFNEFLINALSSARRSGRLIRGFENAEKKLTAERKGIESVDKKNNTNRVERVSRMLVMANDGSDRFYRQTRKLIDQNRPRVMAIHLEITSFEIGKKLFGPGQRALLLLVSHKEAVSNVLISLL